MYLLGFDVGSSSIKAALVDAESGQTIAIVKSPQVELSMNAPQQGWAEQDPNSWWRHLCLASSALIVIWRYNLQIQIFLIGH